ncbi:MAG: hypothetical protein WC701_11915 [Kiritimatiellales bacterium]|jgi:PBP1b-binding outer membrane lipoprotein LpoB
MNSVIRWLILSLAFFIGGCGTLNQPVKSSAPHAVLQFMPVDKSGNRYYEIRKVDDHMVHAGWFFPRNYRVSPGEHTLIFNEMVVWNETVNADGLVIFTAAAAATAGGHNLSVGSTSATFTRRESQIITNKLTVVAGRIYVFDESGIMQSENYE